MRQLEHIAMYKLMRFESFLLLLLAAVSLVAADPSSPPKPRAAKPHILFVLVDDYGWGNLGYHRAHDDQPGADQARAEVNTPNLDKLIGEGIYLERAYGYKICSPARSSIQSGRLPNRVNTKNVNVNHYNSTDPVSGYAGVPTNMTGLASKLQQGGYSTHFVGKWDAGMAHPLQTPLGKGYESFFGYFQHANDYWMKGMDFESTGEVDTCLNRWVDFSLYNATYKGGVNHAVSSEYGCTQDVERFNAKTSIKDTLSGIYNATGCSMKTGTCLMDECYEETMLLRRSLKVIEDHASISDSKPLFLFHAFHAVHTPLQAPQAHLDEIDRVVKQKGGKPIATRQRRLYAAMVLYMDDIVGQLRKKLEEKGMWDDTLVIFSSDNGGPIYEPAAANNYPLRGGKFSDFEGGVRVNSFVSGGQNVIPQKNRGTEFAGIVSIADWYGTLCEIAGVDSFDDVANRTNSWLAARNLPLLPAVDSVSQWQFILNGSNARPGPLQLSAQAVLEFPYKLIVGRQPYSSWQAPLYPNCSVAANAQKDGPLVEDMQLFNTQLTLSPFQRTQDHLAHASYCKDGCLFNVEVDPGEHHDLAVSPDPATLAKLKQLQDSLQKLNEDNFEPYRGTEVIQACEVQAGIGGFFGPFVESNEFYSPVHLSPAEQKANKKLMEKLHLLNFVDTKFGNIVDKIARLFPTDLLMKGLDVCRVDSEMTLDDSEIVV